MPKSCKNCIHNKVCTEANKFAYSYRIVHNLAKNHKFFQGQDIGILGLPLYQMVAKICKHYKIIKEKSNARKRNSNNK